MQHEACRVALERASFRGFAGRAKDGWTVETTDSRAFHRLIPLQEDDLKRLLLLVLFVSLASAQEPWLRRTKPRHYRIEVRTTVKNHGAELTRLMMDLPLPTEGPEQDVGPLQLNGAELQQTDEGLARYARFEQNADQVPKSGNSHAFKVRFEVTLYALEVDFTLIGPLRPYDRESELYRRFTKSNLPYINLEEPRLQPVAERLWNASRGQVVDYARAAYLYVAQNYRYLNPCTGFHPLNKLLDQGGGDCGNLSSIFVTLLRMKGIPSRHVVGTRPSVPHVWAEFYLEQVGWIPVDVTFKNSHPKRDYFGKLDHDSNAIVLHRDLGILCRFDNQRVQAPSLQTGAWWYWGKAQPGQLKLEHRVKDLDRWFGIRWFR